MSFDIFINGNKQNSRYRDGTLRVKKGVNKTTVTELELQTANVDNFRPERGDVVRVDEDGTKIFQGNIDEVIETNPDGVDPSTNEAFIFYKIDAKNNNSILDRRTISKAWRSSTTQTDFDFAFKDSNADWTVKEIVQDIHSNILSDDGISLGQIDGGSVEVDEYVANYEYLSDVFDDLANKANATWRVDKNKKLQFETIGVNSASWDVNDGNLDRLQNLSYEESGDQKEYFNRVIVRGVEGSSEKPFTEELTVTNDQGKLPLTFPIEKLLSLKVNGVEKINKRDFVEEGFIFVGGAPKFSWRKGETHIQRMFGPNRHQFDRNSIEEGTYKIKYIPQNKNSVIVEDSAEQSNRASIEGGSGIHTKVFDKTFETMKAAREFAQDKLDRHSKLQKKVKYTTYRNDISVGEQQTFNITAHDIGGDFMIEELEIRDEGRNDETLLRKASLIPKPVGGWQKYFGDRSDSSTTNDEISYEPSGISSSPSLNNTTDTTDGLDQSPSFGSTASTLWVYNESSIGGKEFVKTDLQGNVIWEFDRSEAGSVPQNYGSLSDPGHAIAFNDGLLWVVEYTDSGPKVVISTIDVSNKGTPVHVETKEFNMNIQKRIYNSMAHDGNHLWVGFGDGGNRCGSKGFAKLDWSNGSIVKDIEWQGITGANCDPISLDNDANWGYIAVNINGNLQWTLKDEVNTDSDGTDRPFAIRGRTRASTEWSAGTYDGQAQSDDRENPDTVINEEKHNSSEYIGFGQSDDDSGIAFIGNEMFISRNGTIEVLEVDYSVGEFGSWTEKRQFKSNFGLNYDPVQITPGS